MARHCRAVCFNMPLTDSGHPVGMVAACSKNFPADAEKGIEKTRLPARSSFVGH